MKNLYIFFYVKSFLVVTLLFPSITTNLLACGIEGKMTKDSNVDFTVMISTNFNSKKSFLKDFFYSLDLGSSACNTNVNVFVNCINMGKYKIPITGNATVNIPSSVKKVKLPNLQGKKIIAAVENAYPPFNFIDKQSGQPIGWDYDIINEVCKRLNCVPKFKETSWEGLVVAVSNGTYDIAGDGITITDKRDEIVDFSIGLAPILERLMVRLNERRFKSTQEFLEGNYTIGAQIATSNHETAKNFYPEQRIISYDDFGSMVQALIAGDVDAVIIDDVTGQGYIGENDNKIKMIPGEVQAKHMLGFIFSQGSKFAIDMDAALLSMIDDGTLNNINIKWKLRSIKR